MQIGKPKIHESEINELIDRLLADLNHLEAHEDEYAKITDQIEKLQSLRDNPKRNRVSPDTIVTASANLLGILLIVGHEHVGVITSRAFGLLRTVR